MRHHEDQGALKTGQGQSCGEVQIRVGFQLKISVVRLKDCRTLAEPIQLEGAGAVLP